ncbi:MAG: hypothetical protein SF339_16110, partial [Blastocatellia bacterium]|nr:hypothetical protein [Blastocatellia bacterium]
MIFEGEYDSSSNLDTRNSLGGAVALSSERRGHYPSADFELSQILPIKSVLNGDRLEFRLQAVCECRNIGRLKAELQTIARERMYVTHSVARTACVLLLFDPGSFESSCGDGAAAA